MLPSALTSITRCWLRIMRAYKRRRATVQQSALVVNQRLSLAVQTPKHISTSFVERHNWTVRTAMRRYTRLSNGFSRKIENHAVAVALNYFAYNFIQIDRTLRTSPAMAAGVTDDLWSVVLILSPSKGLWARKRT